MIETTTPRALAAALQGRIATITPTHPIDRDGGWRPASDNRSRVTSSLVPRRFTFELVPGGTVPGGLTGNGDTETAVGFDLVVDYRGFDPEVLGEVVEHDQWDVHDAIHDSINIVPGLTHVELAGEPSIEGDDREQRMRLPFTLHYMRRR